MCMFGEQSSCALLGLYVPTQQYEFKFHLTQSVNSSLQDMLQKLHE